MATNTSSKFEVISYVRSVIEIVAVLYAAFTVVNTMNQVKGDLIDIKNQLGRHETRITVIEALSKGSTPNVKQ